MLFLFQNAEFRKLVIDLNTKSQLYTDGIDSNGIKLSEYTRNNGYSNYTKAIKEEKGQPTDRITLNDTGKFYKSFRIVFFDNSLQIVANPIKDDTNLFNEWGIDIVGLTEENMNIVISYAKIILLPYIKQQLLK